MSCTPCGSSVPFCTRLHPRGMRVAQNHGGMTYRRDLHDRRCAFCGRPRQEVRKLVAGPNVFICDRCVIVCKQLLVDDRRAASRAAGLSASKPKDLKARLDEWVIGQERAKRMLTVAVYNHLKRIALKGRSPDVDLQKSN